MISNENVSFLNVSMTVVPNQTRFTCLSEENQDISK